MLTEDLGAVYRNEVDKGSVNDRVAILKDTSSICRRFLGHSFCLDGIANSTQLFVNFSTLLHAHTFTSTGTNAVGGTTIDDRINCDIR